MTAIRRALSHRWDATLLRENAARFAPARFREALSTSVLGALGSASGGVRPARSWRSGSDG
jgi:hypothetical protein